jgi:hypothetical protein
MRLFVPASSSDLENKKQIVQRESGRERERSGRGSNLCGKDRPAKGKTDEIATGGKGLAFGVVLD